MKQLSESKNVCNFSMRDDKLIASEEEDGNK